MERCASTISSRPNTRSTTGSDEPSRSPEVTKASARRSRPGSVVISWAVKVLMFSAGIPSSNPGHGVGSPLGALCISRMPPGATALPGSRTPGAATASKTNSAPGPR